MIVAYLNFIKTLKIMLKDILKLAGAKELSKYDQKSMYGSGPLKPSGGCCNPGNDCCVPNDGCDIDCATWGSSSCQFLYSDPNTFPVPCCI